MAFDFSNATSSKFFNFLKNITGIGPVDGSDLIDPATEQLEEESFDDEYTVKMKGTDFNAETYMKPAEEQRLSERSTAAAESKAEKDKASEAEKQNEKLYIFSGEAGSYTRDWPT